jgi:hypothetical protein
LPLIHRTTLHQFPSVFIQNKEDQLIQEFLLIQISSNRKILDGEKIEEQSEEFFDLECPIQIYKHIEVTHSNLFSFFAFFREIFLMNQHPNRLRIVFFIFSRITNSF